MTLRLGPAVLVVALLVAAAPREAAAQDPAPRLNFSAVTFMPGVVERTPVNRFEARPAEVEKRRPSILMASLYAATAITQGLDAHSTMNALHAGAFERNPMMSYLTRHPSAFVAVKAGSAVGLIFAGRNMAKHSKKQAVIALIAVNSVYVGVAAHNYRVANRLR